MQTIDSTLWIEFSDFIAAGFKEDTIKKANLRNGPFWQMMRNPNDARRPMVQYDTLRDEHKQKLRAHYGDLHEYMARQPIIGMLKPADTAERWFLAYTYDGPSGPKTHLSDEHIRMCTKRAQWLDMLITVKPKDVKQITGLREMPVFYKHVITLANLQGANLPETYNRVMILARDYQDKGLSALLPPRLGNRNGLKVSDATAQALLLQLIADPRQHDDVFVSRSYNAWAQANGYETITDAAVGVWRRKHSYLINMDRQGNKEWRNKYGLVIKGQRPSSPLLMWEHDDNHIDLFYQTESTPYQRVKGIFVIDSHCDYVLGYWITPGELKAEHVRMAYLMAMRHVYELTGAWYLPHETKSDRWNGKTLTPFYERIGHYQKSTVGGSRGRGYIEQFFGTNDWQNALKAGANNYNGHNITARNTGMNVEWLKAQEKDRPALTEAPNQIAQFVEKLRHMPTKSGKSRQQHFIESFTAMADDRKRKISDDQMLSIFGLRHEPATGTTSITNRGVDVQIKGQRLLYTLPPAYLLANIGKKVTVQYDPMDMSRVLLTDDDRLRLVATYNPGIAKAMADYKPGHREQLNSLLDQQIMDVATVTQAGQERATILRKANIDPEGLLKAGVLIKEGRQIAEQQLAGMLAGGGYDYALPPANANDDDDDDFNPLMGM
jgi:hypothetical protein